MKKYFLLFIFHIFLNTLSFAHEQVKLQILKVNQQLLVEPNETRLLLHRAGLYYAHGDFSLALKDARDVKKINIKTEKAWLIEIRSLMGLERFSEALSIAGKAIKIWPNNKGILLNLARIQAQFPEKINDSLENYDKAISLYEKVDPALLIERVSLQLSTGFKGYEIALKQLIQARYNYGFIFVVQKKALDIALEIKHLDTALEITKDICQNLKRHDIWLKKMGDIYVLQGKRDKAKKYYKKALFAIESLSNRQKKHLETVNLKKELNRLLASKK